MRSARYLWVAVTLGACTSVHNPDATHGEIVFTHGPFSELVHRVEGGPPKASAAYQRVLVIAPPGATECDAGFGPVSGPLRRGVPDESRGVVLDLRRGRERVRVRCDTESGSVFREVEAVVVSRLTLRYGPRRGQEIVTRQYPPIIHVGELDTEALERWRRFHQQICTREQLPANLMFTCDEESFAALRHADIGS